MADARSMELAGFGSWAGRLSAVLETVLETDPEFADGNAWLGYLYGDQYHHRWNEETDVYDSLDRAKEFAETAMRLDPTSHVVHGSMALTLFFRGDYERARMESLKTIDLNPNDALWTWRYSYTRRTQS